MSFRNEIKKHNDVITVPEEINKLYEQYEAAGCYQMGKKVLNTFTYGLTDGTLILVYWKDGVFYEEITDERRTQNDK